MPAPPGSNKALISSSAHLACEANTQDEEQQREAGLRNQFSDWEDLSEMFEVLEGVTEVEWKRGKLGQAEEDSAIRMAERGAQAYPHGLS